jgi:hypothetical protein
MRRNPRCKTQADGPPIPPRPPADDCKHARYDDDFDDDRRDRGRQEHPTTMGMIGFIMSLVSLALLVVVVILYIAHNQEEQVQQVRQRRDLLYYWFVIVDVASFFFALMATILTARGLAPSNPLYRGWSIAGLILSIIEIVVTLFFGLFMGFTIVCCIGVAGQ